jgi:alcohol dehydrogenase
MNFGLYPFRMPRTLLAGGGAADRVGEEAKRLGGTRALVITDQGVLKSGWVDKTMERLHQAGLKTMLFSEVMAEPHMDFLDATAGRVREGGADLVVGVGGGSSLDTAKMVACLLTNGGRVQDYFGIDQLPQRGLPMMMLPTTAGTGSEVTPNAIFTDTAAKLKKGVVSPFLLPDVAIVDPHLTVSCPPAVTAATGMDALTHAIESYTSVKATPLTDLYAMEAIRIISHSLRTAVFRGSDLEARTHMALGSMMAGVSLANAGVGAVHALAYPVGGKFGVPHGVSNSQLMPYVMEYNVLGNIHKFAEVARLMGAPVEGLSAREAAQVVVAATRRLGEDIGIPMRMSHFQVTADAIPEMAQQAFANRRLMDNNPRNLTLDEVRAIYEKAL